MADGYAAVKAWRDAQGESLTEIRREEARRYRTKHPDKVKAARDRYRSLNRDKVRELDRDAQKRRRADPDGNKRRLAAFKARQEQKRADEAGRPRPDTCELCGEVGGKIVFDHCHKHGHFRGWICDRCNKTLGMVHDSTDLLLRMRDYLIRTGKQDG